MQGTTSSPAVFYFLQLITVYVLLKFVYMKELTNTQKKEWAKMLYLQDQYTQKQIAQKVNVTEATLSKWAKADAWDKLRKSLLTSKSEILQNLYTFLDKINQKLKDDESFGDSKMADMYVKYTAAIKNLETDTSISQLMEAGMKFHKFVLGTDAVFALRFLNEFDAFIKDNLKRY